MKENRYDDEQFFKKYSEMPYTYIYWRVVRTETDPPGFSGEKSAGSGLRVWLALQICRRRHGAVSVLGTDISHRMLETARQKNSDPRITYQCAAMEDLDFPAESFDCVISSLAFHYVKDFSGLASRIGRWLKPGGDLVFSVEHPGVYGLRLPGLVL